MRVHLMAAIVTLAALLQAHAQTPPELIYYKFDSVGVIVNQAMTPVGINPAYISGSGLSVTGTGMFGSALSGTGSPSVSNVINTQWQTLFINNFTIGFWIHGDSTSTNMQYLFGDSNPNILHCTMNQSGGSWDVSLRSAILPDITIYPLSASTPHYIHFVYNGNSGVISAYSDGVLQVTLSAPVRRIISGNVFQIGGNSSLSGLHGFMDEFRVYDRALTSTEIQATYNTEIKPTDCLPPLVKAVFSLNYNLNLSYTWPDGADSVGIEWGSKGFVRGMGNTMTTLDSNVIIDNYNGAGLHPDSCYDMYVYSYCNGIQSTMRFQPYTACMPCILTGQLLEDFENPDWVVGTSSIYSGVIDSCWNRSPLDIIERDFLWHVESGSTPPGNTGPDSDISGMGKYLFSFHGSKSMSKTTSLISPAIDLSTLSIPFLQFGYHMFGADIEHLSIDVWDGNQWHLDEIKLIGQQHNSSGEAWKRFYYPLSHYAQDTVMFRINSEQSGNLSQTAIDEFFVIDASSYCLSPWDFALDSIDSTSAHLSWKTFAGNNLTVQWGQIGFVPGTSQEDGSSTNLDSVVTISGLNPIKAYDVYVMDSCNGAWVGPIKLCPTTLSGIYGVGGPTGPRNFPTLQGAFNRLMNCGISGPVTLNLSGNYVLDSTLLVGHVDGMSSINTITIDGGNSNMTTLSALYGSVDPVIRLINTGYVTIRNMTIVPYNFSYATVIEVTESEYVNIEQNRILMDTVNNIYFEGGIFLDHCENVNVLNNEFIGGSYLIRSHSILSDLKNITLADNLLRKFHKTGISLLGCQNLEIIRNRIYSDINQGIGSAGIELQGNEQFIIEGNYIRVNEQAIFIESKFNNAGYGLIFNNILIAQGGGKGILFEGNNNHFQIYHNSIQSGGRGIEFTNLTDYDIRNNIIVSNGYAINALYLPDSVSKIDHNLYHRTSPGALLKIKDAYVNLQALKGTNPGHNSNSIQGDPVFVSPDDLHVTGILPFGKGDTSLSIVSDFDGDPRPLGIDPNPDIGADEYFPRLTDALAVNLIPSDNQHMVCADSSFEIGLVVMNNGLSPLTNFVSTVEISGDISDTLAVVYTDTLFSAEIDTVYMGYQNIVNAGHFTSKGFLSFAGDTIHHNDTIPPYYYNVLARHQVQGWASTDSLCEGDTVSLYAMPQTEMINLWYYDKDDMLPFASGDTISTVVSSSQNVFWLGGGVGPSTSITTTFMSNSGSSGNMFDVNVKRDIKVDGFASRASVNNLEVYYRKGTYVGHDSSMTGWIKLEIHENTSHSGPGYRADLNIPLMLKSGQSYAFFFLSASGMSYTIGTTEGAVYVSNADLDIMEGIGLDSLQGSVFSPRIWNGSFFYSIASCYEDKYPIHLDVSSQPVALATAIYPGGYGTGLYEFDANGSQGELYWDFGDGTQVIGDTSLSHTYTSNGTYWLTLIAKNSCSSDTVKLYVIVAGLDLKETALSRSLNIYPNPSDGIFNLEFSFPDETFVNLQVISSLGKVCREEYLGKIYEYNGTINLFDLPKGVYILKLQTGNAIVNRRLILR